VTTNDFFLIFSTTGSYEFVEHPVELVIGSKTVKQFAVVHTHPEGAQVLKKNKKKYAVLNF
jgi:hypothetical protein